MFIAIAVDNLAQAQAMTAAELAATQQLRNQVIVVVIVVVAKAELCGRCVLSFVR